MNIIVVKQQEMKKLLSIIIALTATMTMAAQTPEQWDSLRTFKWSVYGQGGVSFASGGHLLSNKLPTPGTEDPAAPGLAPSRKTRRSTLAISTAAALSRRQNLQQPHY